MGELTKKKEPKTEKKEGEGEEKENKEGEGEGGEEKKEAEGEEKKEGEGEGDAEPKNEDVEEPKPADEEEEEEDIAESLTPRSLQKRIAIIVETITYCAFNNVRRGLFERHKDIFAVLLTLKILQKDGVLLGEEVQLLITGKVMTNLPPIPDSLRSYINEN